MAPTSLSDALHVALERHQIHAAVCRPRAQGLACATCSELRSVLLRRIRLALGEAA